MESWTAHWNRRRRKEWLRGCSGRSSVMALFCCAALLAKRSTGMSPKAGSVSRAQRAVEVCT
jgi:hypothetical protein